MDDWVKVVVAGIVTIIGLTISGGAIGKGMMSIAKTLVAAIIEQNAKLTTAIEKNTKETGDLTQVIRLDVEMQKQYNNERQKQLDRLEILAKAAADTSALLAHRLQGRS